MNGVAQGERLSPTLYSVNSQMIDVCIELDELLQGIYLRSTNMSMLMITGGSQEQLTRILLSQGHVKPGDLEGFNQ